MKTRLKRAERALHTPLALLVLVMLGMAFGISRPDVAVLFQPVTEFYLALLKMIVLPFLISSIIFGLRSLILEGSADRYVLKLFGAFVGVSLIAVLVGGGIALWLQPGRISDPAVLSEFGRVISQSGGGTDLQMSLHETVARADPNLFLQLLMNIVPSNIFQALAAGDIVKVLVFTVLFGLAVSKVPSSISDPFGHCLETVYRTCMVLTGWFTRFLPFLTFAMVAQHAADVGLGSLMLMVNFLIVMAIATVIIVVASVAAITWASRHPLRQVVGRGQEIAGMSLSTNSSVACIPVIIDAMIKLGFRREVMELVVPLSTAMVRAGPIVCYTVAPIFVAQLYDRPLGWTDLGFLFASAALLGSTTAGMSGILVLTQIGIICKGLNLPFEAAFVLFASIDRLTDTLRSLMLVFATAGTAAIITPRKAKRDYSQATNENEELISRGSMA